MYRFCRIGNTNLICYRNGTVLRFHKYLKKWFIVKGSNVKGYLTIKIDKKMYRMHRVLAHAFKILDLHSELLIDHIDRNRSNNCIENLRPVTTQQNGFNQGAKGYCWNQHKKWKAYITLDGIQNYLGCFDTKEEAHTAYLEAKKKYHPLGV
jgi:hypothetical protein